MPRLIHQTFIDAHCEPGPPLAPYLLRTQKKKISLGRNMEFPIIPLIMALFSHSKNNIGGACCAAQSAEISQGLSFIPHTFVKHLPRGRLRLRALQRALSLLCQQTDFQSQRPDGFRSQEQSVPGVFLRAVVSPGPGYQETPPGMRECFSEPFSNGR